MCNALRCNNSMLLLSLLIITGLTACKPAEATIKPVLSSTRASSSTPTFTPTVTTTATKTPFPPLILYPTFTKKPPTPPLTWSGKLGTPIVIDQFNGIWSPAENKLVGYQWTGSYTTTLVIVSAPDFIPIAADFEKEFKVYQYQYFRVKRLFNWSPDGQWVLFYLPKEGADYDEPVTLWMMNNLGQSPHTVFSDESIWLFSSFIEWLSDRNLVESLNIRGGGIFIRIIDFQAGYDLAGCGVNGGYALEPNSKFVPVISNYFHPIISVISTLLQTGYQTTLFCNNARDLPINQIESSPEQLFNFRGWLPGTNQMLISWFEYGLGDQLSGARLLKWNLDSNQVRTVVPGGVDGRYAPDGKTLAFVTLGPASFNLKDLSGRPKLDVDLPEAQPYLQLLETGSQQVIMSVPVITYQKEWDFDGKIYETPITFSNDSRYLTFFTTGQIELDSKQWPIDLIKVSADQIYLNILDLIDKRLVQSFAFTKPEANYDRSGLLWSPRDHKIIYRDDQGNWQLFNIDSLDSLPITLSVAGLTLNPVWSFDGQYLSFSPRNEHYELIDGTIIFKIP